MPDHQSVRHVPNGPPDRSSSPLDLTFESGRIIVLDEVDSTNDEARRRLVSNVRPAPPFSILARRQTAGRGRGRNTWYSDEGSLIATTAFDPRSVGLRPEHEPRLALAFAACLLRRIEEKFGAELGTNRLGIRWPNDLESGGRKFGGILPERVDLEGGHVILFGVGLNLTTNLDQAPREVHRLATTLDSLTSYRVPEPLLRLAVDTHPALSEAVDRLARDDSSLASDWEMRDTLRGVPVSAILPNRNLEGVGAGIDAEGRLHVAHEHGVDVLTGGVILRAR